MPTYRDIIDYSVYVPNSVIARTTIGEALGTRGGSGVRSVASYDEDPITLGVAAATGLSLPEAAQRPVTFASANLPYLDKSNADVVKAALAGDSWVTTTDMSGLRAGFNALSTSSMIGGLAVLGDQKSGRPGSAEEGQGGDGGAAFLFGESPTPVARVLGGASVSMEVMDTWRVPGEEHSHVWEERFSQHVLGKAISEVVAQVGKDADFPGAPTYSLVSTPSARFATATARSIGASGDADLLAQHREQIGYCGAADIGLLLGRALDAGRAGDTVLLVGAVGSVDALLVEILRDGPGTAATDEALSRRRPISYLDFLTWRGLVEREPSRRPERDPVAAPPAFRNASWKFGLIGGRCEVCGKVYLPAPRVCGGCGTADRFTPYPLAHRRGTVQAVTTDAVSDSPAPPAMAAMVDFDEGGRLTVELTDCAEGSVAAGDPVQMTFRRTYRLGSGPNYFWKARPIEQGEGR